MDDIKAAEPSSCVAGPFGSNISSKYFVPHGVPVIRGSNLTDDLTPFVPDQFVFVSSERALSYRAQHVRAGDLVFTCWGTIGQVGLIPEDGPFDEYVISNKQLKLRPNAHLADPRFLFYYFASPGMVEHIRNHAIGSAVPGINLGILKGLPVVLPPLRTQQKIVAVLSAYDDLIENNNRRIKVLEEMARRIYREWFLDLRYPRHEDGPLVESQFGLIPLGWNVITLGEDLEVLEAGSRPKGGIDPSQRGVPSVGAENIRGLGRYDYSKEKYVSASFFESMRRGRVMDGDVLLYKDGAYIGRTSLFRDAFPHRECAINEHVFRLRTRQLPQSYLYFWLSSAETQDRVRALNANAAQPGLNQPAVRGLDVLIPFDGVLRDFDVCVEPLLALIFTCAQANRRLRTTRDVLLPRLISGEIDFADLDIPVPDLAA